MSKHRDAADSIENGLTRFTETEYVQRELRDEVNHFVFSFSIYRCRPAEARALTGRVMTSNDPKVLKPDCVIDLYTRMVEAAVLEKDRLERAGSRCLLPFLDIDPETRTLRVNVVPFDSSTPINSQQELRNSIFMIRDTENYLNDAAVDPKGFPHIRELLKSFFVYVHVQFSGGKRLGYPLEVDFALAHKMLESLEFTPGESLRDLSYQDKYEKFKKLMEAKGYEFSAQKKDFQQWMKAKDGDPVHARIRQVFERDLEAALAKKVGDLKEDLAEQFRMMAERQKPQASTRTETVRAEVSGKLETLLRSDTEKLK